MTRTRYRVILLLLGVAFTVVVLGAVLLAPQGASPGLPDAVNRIEPGDGELVFAQPQVVLDLEPGYRAVLTVDGIVIPDDQVIWTQATGLHVFDPGPGKAIESWSPGFHLVEANWDGPPGQPDPGGLTWTFRVQ
jgi:hypothetical protein